MDKQNIYTESPSGYQYRGWIDLDESISILKSINGYEICYIMKSGFSIFKDRSDRHISKSDSFMIEWLIENCYSMNNTPEILSNLFLKYKIE